MDFRARRFLKKAAGDFGSSALFIGMFLLGAWFVRSGVMERSSEHLPLFRRLACYGLPLGIGLGLAGSLIAMHHTPGDRLDGYAIAQGSDDAGQPAGLPGLCGPGGADAARRAGLVAHPRAGTGGAHGADQLPDAVAAVLAGFSTTTAWASGACRAPGRWCLCSWCTPRQVAFSHWWLARFRYGPTEWLWRGFTYRETPRLRL